MTDLEPDIPNEHIILAAVNVVMAQFASAEWLRLRMGTRHATAERLLSRLEEVGILSSPRDNGLPRLVLLKQNELHVAIEAIDPHVKYIKWSLA